MFRLRLQVCCRCGGYLLHACAWEKFDPFAYPGAVSSTIACLGRVRKRRKEGRTRLEESRDRSTVHSCSRNLASCLASHRCRRAVAFRLPRPGENLSLKGPHAFESHTDTNHCFSRNRQHTGIASACDQRIKEILLATSSTLCTYGIIRIRLASEEPFRQAEAKEEEGSRDLH
jgi:hypothetical protein